MKKIPLKNGLPIGILIVWFCIISAMDFQKETQKEFPMLVISEKVSFLNIIILQESYQMNALLSRTLQNKCLSCRNLAG